MARLEFYDQNQHSVIVDGLAIEDFHDGEDAIAFAPEGQLVGGSRGLDRNRISLGSPRMGTLTLRLKPTSPSIDFLNELANLAGQGQARLFDCVISTGVADVLSMVNCAAIDTDYQTGGPNMQTRTFEIMCENYEISLANAE